MIAGVPLLSIIIPTRNRYEYAIHSFDSVLALDSTDVEVVIHDCSDDRRLEEYIIGKNKGNSVRYVYCPRPMNSVENFNVAAGFIQGEYSCFIGDDDTINPEIVEIARWARENSVDALTPTLCANYFWPDIGKGAQGSGIAGGLFITRFSSRIEAVDGNRQLLRLARDGGQDYLYRKLAKAYHGLVRTECLVAILKEHGAFFKGLSPDIYSAVMLTKRARRIYSIDYPLTIGGSSVKSTAGDSIAKKHKGKFEDMPHLKDRGSYEWNELVPKFYSVQTVWAETALVAFLEKGMERYLSGFNYLRLYGVCAVMHREYMVEIKESLDLYCARTNRSRALCRARVLFEATRFIAYKCGLILRRVIRNSLFDWTRRFGSYENVEEAQAALKDAIGGRRVRLEKARAMDIEAR